MHILNIIARRARATPRYWAPRESSMVLRVRKMMYVSRLSDMFLM
jgi:hypothetical protein